MATTQKNSDFLKLREVKKGAYGEYLAKKYFVEEHYIIYRPTINGSHGFDFFLYDNEKEKYIAVEVKTKAKCRNYPETGFNQNVYERYCQLSNEYNMPVLVVFVDEDEKRMYGNYLSELCKPIFIDEEKAGHYPKFKPSSDGTKNLVYFHMSSMNTFRALTDNEVAQLKKT